MSQPHGFSDLTIGEVKTIASHFFTAVFVCLVVFVIPWELIVGLVWTVDAVSPSETPAWLIKMLFFGILALFAWFLINHLPEFLRSIGKTFTTLGDATVGASRMKRTLGVILFIGNFYLMIEHFTIAFFIWTLVIIPASFAFDTYQNVLRQKEDQKEGTD